ncbi:RNase H domain-containing protein [Trichonephila clavipes]|nr:RNase H domain-containing protein [Trichonephila clavipes]
MDLSKSPSPDDIHGVMIDHLGPHGMQRLLDLFSLSWRLGRLPRVWRRAIIIPILKPGKDASSPHSFRHITLTSFIYTVGSRGDGGTTDSGVHILTPTRVMDIKIKNQNFCSVFRSELIAIKRGLPYTCETEFQLKDIELHHLGRTPPSHPSYFGKNSGGSSNLCLGNTRLPSRAFCLPSTSKTDSIGEMSDDLAGYGSFIVHDHTPPSCPKSGKNPNNTGCNVGSVVVNCASASRLRMVSFDSASCLEGGKWCRIDSSDVVGEDVAALIIAQSSRVFVSLGRPDPPRW